MIEADVIPYSAESIPAEILRNLKLLYGTRVGEQALDRDFGLEWSFIDKPYPVARALLAREVIEKTQRYEKRVRVKNVDFSADAVNGIVRPKVVIALV